MSKKNKAAKEKTGKDKLEKDKKGKAVPGAVQPKKEAAPVDEKATVPVESQPADEVSSGTSSKDAGASEKTSGSLTGRQITLISKALADPTRMAVLRSIAKGGTTCSGLRDCAGVSAATLSHHMKELEGAGLIETERTGRFVSAVFQRRTWKKYIEELKALSK